MKSDEIRKTNPLLLSRLMDLDFSESPGWDRDELGAILRHQLASSLRSGLGAASFDELGRRLAGSGGFPDLGTMSFGTLLLHPRPPLDALRLVKEFGKALRNEKSRRLPREVATIIYYGSIAAAGLRCGASISRLDPDKLRKGFRWALSQPWLDPSMRNLFEEETRRLGEVDS
jgi:hypothetical protein